MEESLKDDGKDSMSKLASTLDAIASFLDASKSGELKLNDLTVALLSGFVKLRAANWGRCSVSDALPALTTDPSSSSGADPHHDKDFYNLVRMSNISLFEALS